MINTIFRKIEAHRKNLNVNKLENDIAQINLKPVSRPTSITLALSNVCNYSCPICSINLLKKNGIKRVKNNISYEIIKSFKPLLNNLETINFMGLIGESILNPDFKKICIYLKNRNIQLSMSSNGYGLTSEIQDMLVDIGFDSLIISIHAATPETYKKLQGGFFDTVINQVENLQKKKKMKSSDKPFVTIAYALNRENIDEATKMIDFVKLNNIESLNFYKYNDYGWSEIALDNDIDYANKKIDKIYTYAKEKDALMFIPQIPPYFKEKKIIENISDSSEEKCFLPWTGLQMRSCYSHEDSVYLGCCNVFNAFLFNYKIHNNHYGTLQFEKIWHHPIFQYLRKTVNSTDKCKRNPLCAYCKSDLRRHLKHVDNAKNYEIKLSKIDEFFENYHREYKKKEPEIIGLNVLYTEDDELQSMSKELNK